MYIIVFERFLELFVDTRLPTRGTRPKLVVNQLDPKSAVALILVDFSHMIHVVVAQDL